MRLLEEIEDEALERLWRGILGVGGMRSKIRVLVIVCRLDISSKFVFCEILGLY